MYFKQFYLGCLAHASYLIGSQGVGVVIDPQRDVDQYIEEARKQELQIKYVIETHLHADFVSGHRELAERTGAEIVFGAKANAKFPHVATKHGDLLKAGSLEMKVLETPGHTPESICVLVTDTSNPDAPAKLFSGDTLFIGDIGRPDLVAVKGHSAEEMAASMYESLNQILLKLDDQVEVYPAHGAGSLCGKSLSAEKSSTIGREKKFNYALQPMSKEAFIAMLIADQPEVPAYFPKDVEMNQTGASPLSALPKPQLMQAAEVIKELQRGAVVLDVRDASKFAEGHIRGSYNISLSGQFASWAGTIIEVGTPVILTADDFAQVEEAVMRLARIGIESVIGFQCKTENEWCTQPFDIERSQLISVNSLNERMSKSEQLLVIDVRREGEFSAEHISGAVNIPLAELSTRLSEIPQDKEVAVICAGGYRSSIGVSLLLRGNFSKVVNVIGGFSAWKKTGYTVVSKEPALA
jgi:hydroxyacylglutathione hydrolase